MMTKQEALTIVQNIARDILDNDNLLLTFETTTEDIEDWDSLNHIQIVSEIQKTCKIKFSAKEMISWNNLGDLCESMAAKSR